MTTPREQEREVDGAYEAFRERVRWLYKNAPECQEARKHSFSRQGDVAFTLAMAEREAAIEARVLATVRERVEGMRLKHDENDEMQDYYDKLSHNDALNKVLATLTPEPTDGPT